MLRRLFGCNHNSSLPTASSFVLLRSSFRQFMKSSSSSTSSTYTMDDFLNEDDIVAPTKPIQKPPAPKPKFSSSQPAVETVGTEEKRSAVEAQPQHQNQHQHQQQQLLSPALRAPHSLSEFLVRCDDLVVGAKRNPRDTARQARVRAFWNSHVARAVEMNSRNAHDLACVAVAGRAFGLTIPFEKDQDRNSIYAGWTLLQRYRDMTRCADLMAATSLLVRSQPPIQQQPQSGGSAGESSGVEEKQKVQMNLLQLQSSHHKFSVDCIRHYFGEVDEKNDKIRCPPKDFPAILDVLDILHCFTENMVRRKDLQPQQQQQQQQRTGSVGKISSSNLHQQCHWPVPPFHIAPRVWTLIGDVHRCGLRQCSPSLSFSQLVHCLIRSKQLFVRARILTSQSHRDRQEKSEKLDKLRRPPKAGEEQPRQYHQHESGENNRNGRNSSSSSPDKKLKSLTEGIKLTNKYINVLAAQEREIRLAAMLVFDHLIQRISISSAGGSKLVNSFHFVEIVTAADAMFLLQRRHEKQSPALKLLREIFNEKTNQQKQQQPDSSWVFSNSEYKKLKNLLGI